MNRGHEALPEPRYRRWGRLCQRALRVACIVVVLAGCQPGDQGKVNGVAETPGAALTFQAVGKLESDRLDEASGMQAGPDDVLYLHNDEGEQLFLADTRGRHLAMLEVENSSNRDWEDITRVPGDTGPLLVIGDIGDNRGIRRNVSLYFVPEPAGEARARAVHRVRVRYPDGPRDAESLAYDAAGGRLLILTKRDQPPRLYGVPLDLSLWKQEVVADFLGEVPGFRPPTQIDILRNPGRGLWVSQPTGMDISPDGLRAAVLTYRSLYLFERRPNESWPEAFRRNPTEIVGPPGTHDEAVCFSPDGRSVYVTTEGRPAPLYRLDLPPVKPFSADDANTVEEEKM